MTIEFKRIIQDVSTPEACEASDAELNQLLNGEWRVVETAVHPSMTKMLVTLHKGAIPQDKPKQSLMQIIKLLQMLETMEGLL